MIKQVVLFIVCLGLASGSSYGQNFNLDLEKSAGTPSNTFAGAGSAGHWSTITLTEASFGIPGNGPEIFLTDRNGTVTDVTFQLFMQSGGTSHDGNPGFSGDDASLLADGWLVPDIPGNITIRHLIPGDYRVTVYGTVSDNGGSLTSIFGSDLSGVVGSHPWTGDYIEGQTHITGLVDAGDGEFSFGWAAGTFGDVGIITGIQIEQIPEPASLALLLTGVLPWIRRIARLTA